LILSERQSYYESQQSVFSSGSVKKRSLVEGIVMAVIAVLSASTILPFVNMYEGVPAPTIAIWRYQLTVVYCIPISIIAWKNNYSKIKLKEALTWKTLLEVLSGAILFSFGSLLLINSSRYTLLSHSITLANAGGVFLVIFNLVRCLNVNRNEIIGTLIVIMGIIVLLLDSHSEKVKGDTNIIKGDILALLAMPCYAMSCVCNSKATKKIPSMIVFHFFGVIQILINVGYYFLISDIEVSTLISRDPIYGFFGWSQPQFLWLSLFVIAPICGVLGAGSYIFLLDYFPPHISAGIFLLEPFTCQLFGVLFGQDSLPYLATYIGAIIITFGLGTTIHGNFNSQKIYEGFEHEKIELSEESLENFQA